MAILSENWPKIGDLQDAVAQIPLALTSKNFELLVTFTTESEVGGGIRNSSKNNQNSISILAKGRAL